MTNPSAASCGCHAEPDAAIFDETATLAERRPVSRDTFRLSLRSPRIAAAARPGQFVNVLLPSPDFGYRVLAREDEALLAAGDTGATLIRRPFSICNAYASGGAQARDTIDLLVKVVGRGTALLAALEAGTELSILGPLGNTFTLPPEGASAALVAGGCGWAGLTMLAHALRGRRHPTYALIGAATVEDLPLPTVEGPRPEAFGDAMPEVCATSVQLQELGITVAVAAEQGGAAYRGLVTDLLERFLATDEGKGAHVYACGPWPMLRVVAALAKAAGSPCQVSMEERMGCGIGVCNSCVVEVLLPDGAIGHKKLCVDGPVLDAAEVNWDQEQY